MIANKRRGRLLDNREKAASIPAVSGSRTNATMPAKLGPPGTGAHAGDPSTMKNDAPTTNCE